MAESHGALSEVVNDSEPVPVLVTLKVLEAGLAPPATELNARLAGETASTGVAAAGSTVKVTGTSLGDPVAPVAVTLTLPVYVPAARPLTSADTVRSRGAVPDAGVTDSHGASSEAVKESVPPPLLATLSVLDAGLVPPAVAEKDRLAGVTESAGAAATVSVTGICFGEPVVPVEVTVTVAE